MPPTWSGPAYDGVVRTAVVAWKEQARVDLTAVLAPVLREALAAALTGSPPHTCAVRSHRPVALVPAPSARSGTRTRGRTPVLEVARAAARPDVVVDALRLVRTVRDQAGLSTGERARNLAGAVAVRPAFVPSLFGVPCVIVDDVVTTGATLQECARALRRAGSGPVVAVTIAATARRAKASSPPLPHRPCAD